MKKNIFNITRLLFLGVIFASFFLACEDADRVKYKMTGGVPEVHYVRMTDPLLADSLLAGAFLNQSICLIGENLTSIQELYFNDQKALLNLNFITDKTLLVSVPTGIPEDVTNKIYMITGSGQTVDYDFKVLVPAPQLIRMKNEHAPFGAVDAIFGDYLLDDPNVPIKVTFTGNIEARIVSSNRNEVRYVVPEGALEGPVTVTTQYGTARSDFYFHDSRGWITGFEASENNGAGFIPGWGRPGRIEEDPALALMGKYVVLDGAVAPANDEDSWASMANSTINIWSSANPDNPNPGIPNPMFSGKPENSILKFEVNVLEKWSGSPMIVVFAAANDLEGWLWADGTQPRGFWAPWKDNGGSYVSDGWETVSIPISEMKYSGSEEDIGMPTAFGQLGISVHNRGGKSYIGTPCHPVILVDNVRVVPAE